MAGRGVPSHIKGGVSVNRTVTGAKIRISSQLLTIIRRMVIKETVEFYINGSLVGLILRNIQYPRTT